MIVLCIILRAYALQKPCYIRDDELYNSAEAEFIINPQPWETNKLEDLPDSIDWRDVDGVNWLSPLRNQHIPHYCGSCWDMASVAMISDRINILTKKWPSAFLSAQNTLACSLSLQCQGGNPIGVFVHAKNNGIPHESCNQYKAKDEICNEMSYCSTCNSSGCFPIKHHYRYKVAEYGFCMGYAKMKHELQRGPLTCAIEATSKFEDYIGGIYREKKVAITGNHLISVIGYGVEESSGTEYWIGRNSWGEYWGEGGFFRIVTSKSPGVSGEENLGIEHECMWAMPEIDSSELVQMRESELQRNGLPSSFDLRTAGPNLVNPVRNYAQPNFCKGDWAMAATQSFGDRLNVKDGGKTSPGNFISPEVVLACAAGNCRDGGSVEDAYKYLVDTGVPDETCQNYVAKDQECTAENICMNCAPGKGCWAVDKYPIFQGKSYAKCTDQTDMMTEIYERGTIACQVTLTEKFKNHRGDAIFVEERNNKKTETETVWVSILGWGNATAASSSGNNGEGGFWIGRADRGFEFGEQGFFKLTFEAGKNLGVDQNCYHIDF